MTNLKTFQRLAVTVAGASLAMAGVAAVAVVTQPASTSVEQPETSMRFVEPAGDEEPTSTTIPAAIETAVEETTEGADRAERAAERAEVAAGRAEVAAVKAETVATTTSTPLSGPATETTSRPILVGTVIDEPTTTTTLAKQWVEVARIPAVRNASVRQGSGPPINEIPLTLQTGQLRVSNPKAPYSSTLAGQYGPVGIWVGETAGEGTCWLPQDPNAGTTDCTFESGETTLKVGRRWSELNGGNPTMFGVYATGADLVIEEWR